MRRLLAVLALSFALAGCGGMFAPVHAPTTIENEKPTAKAVRLAHVAVDEAYAALTAVNTVIRDNVKAGVWTKAQAQGYLDRSKAYRKDVDEARELLRIGTVAGVQPQAELIKTFILMFQKEVAEAARKGQS